MEKEEAFQPVVDRNRADPLRKGNGGGSGFQDNTRKIVVVVRPNQLAGNTEEVVDIPGDSGQGVPPPLPGIYASGFSNTNPLVFR